VSIEQFQENESLLLFASCNDLKSAFLSLKEPRDVADLLEVSYDRLIYHLYKASDDEKYKEFAIPKKTGRSRRILSPSSALKIIQRKLSQVLYSVYEPKAPVQGFVPNRSILTNAGKHLQKRYVLNIDLQDFFDSIHFGRVRGIFIAPPYHLPEKVATVLAQICCFSNRLPQGAPTSPIVSNMVCARLDTQLRHLAKESKCTFTRYADDITFSTTLPVFPTAIAVSDNDSEFTLKKVFLGDRIVSVIEDNGFRINWSKVRLQHRTQHQEVTGITVNDFPNVKRKFVRQISSMLHVWDKFGLEAAQQRYMEMRSKELGIPKEQVPPFQEVLRGKINFLGMVRGKNSEIFLKYWRWYKKLSAD
jgi:RNA-directed DNA polymerase